MLDHYCRKALVIHLLVSTLKLYKAVTNLQHIIIVTDELPVSSDPTDTEKADMRIVQAAGHEV